MVEVALIAGAVSLVTVFITTLALRRVRQTQSLVNLVHAHRTIAEDAISAYERARSGLQESIDQQDFQERLFKTLDRLGLILADASGRTGTATTDPPLSRDTVPGTE